MSGDSVRHPTGTLSMSATMARLRSPVGVALIAGPLAYLRSRRGPPGQSQQGRPSGLGQLLRPRKSLTGNAMSLMVATISAQALGLLFWVEAAHFEPTYTVGRAAAGVAALTLLALLAQLNLTNVFIRFVPVAGRLGGTLAKRGYLVVVCLSFVAGIVYVGTGLSSHVLTGGLVPRALFVLAVPVLSIFALEDSVLIALRLTPWVAAENIAAAVGRLTLLPIMTVPWLGGGTMASWVLPAAVAVIIVNSLLFRRALPALSTGEGKLPNRRRLLSFVAGEYTGTICFITSVQVMPLIVARRLGITQVAYLNIPWLIASGIALVMWNIGASFVVEASRAREKRGKLGPLLRRGVLLWTAIATMSVLVCELGARPLLELQGARYAIHSVELLKIIGLAAPFLAVVMLFWTLAWLEQRVWLLAGFQAAEGAMVLSFALILLPRLGLNAVGWAYLITQMLSALAAAPYLLRWVRRNRLPRVRS